jgi:aerobic carbon-monoxide dehydrogenase large subunit
MDYAVPRADDLPSFVSETDESQPCTHNPLGVADLEMPATAYRVWEAMRRARAAGAP